MIARGEVGGGANASSGGQMRAVTNWRAAYQTNGASGGGPDDFKLELFDQARVLVRP